MDLFDHILELSRYGYFCSQILAILTLELTGEENPKLVQAMGGLDGGVGYSKNNCGCLTGGACLISYFTGKGSDFEAESPEALWLSFRSGSRTRSPPITAASTARILSAQTPRSVWSTARRSLPLPMKNVWRSCRTAGCCNILQSDYPGRRLGSRP